ncbi:MAG: hypothetical protein NTV86_05225 [Planctomycetota bacterium]|nr:hypothetical protein [Planctomycetota bacterium]
MANGIERDKERETYWRRMVKGQRGSGLTVRAFCRKSKLAESAFYFWRRELQRRKAEQEQSGRGQRRAAGRKPKVAFLPVHVAEEIGPGPQTSGRIEIELAGGRRVHVAAPVDRQALADVVAVLEGRPC